MPAVLNHQALLQEQTDDAHLDNVGVNFSIATVKVLFEVLIGILKHKR